MLKNADNKFDFERNEGGIKNKLGFTKWLKFKKYVVKKRANIDLVDPRVYMETLSVESVKRSLCRVCRRIFKSKHSGYNRFLSDEEKRLMPVDYSLVEGLY